MNAPARTDRLVAAIALAVVLALAAGRASAQAYKYKDDQGHVHFTQDLYDIPEKYRAHLETREMPTHVDPNEAAKANAKDAAVAASFEDGLRQGLGHDLTIKQQDAVHAWFARWLWPALAAVLLNTIIALGMAIHAFVSGKVGWGFANLFIGVSSPFYLMMHLEQPIAVRGGLLLLYLAPFIVLSVAMTELVHTLG
ncbi:MAG TPA: DUF4124 domain-containing protein [Myxococcota bacterium]|nr:DUF4124 domain-containing protein [Myxococcota bacterium]